MRRRPIQPTPSRFRPRSKRSLDGQQSWIVITEVNSFVWPGPDLSAIPGTSPTRFDYCVLPPGFFRKVRDDLVARVKARRVQIVPRSQ